MIFKNYNALRNFSNSQQKIKNNNIGFKMADNKDTDYTHASKTIQDLIIYQQIL